MIPDREPANDPEGELATIEGAVRRAASELLRATDAATALRYYAPAATIVSNGVLYPSLDSLAGELKAFYGSLHEIRLAVWDDVRVDVLRSDAAVFTGRFRWRSTDISGAKAELEGVWTAVFVLLGDDWRIGVRHESFLPREGIGD